MEYFEDLSHKVWELKTNLNQMDEQTNGHWHFLTFWRSQLEIIDYHILDSIMGKTKAWEMMKCVRLSSVCISLALLAVNPEQFMA